MNWNVWFYFAFLAMSMMGSAYASQPLKIASQGKSVAKAEVGKFVVIMSVVTREIDIGKPSDPRPLHLDSSCTYSKFPCSVVVRLEIAVDGNSLFVPRSVFADLADLNTADIAQGPSGPMVVLCGGDAAESYKITIEFDGDEIKRRTLSSTIAPAQVLQETVYHSYSLNE